MFFGFQSEKALANAERLVQQGKFAAAIEIYEKLVEQQPGTLSLKNNLGDLYVQVGRTQKALELFAQVAEYLENEGLHARAIAVMKKMLKLDSSQLELQQRLARMLTAQGMLGEARGLWMGVLERAERAGNWMMAEESLNQLLAAEPESLLLLARSAQLRQRRGDGAAAQQEWFKLGRKAIERAALESVDEALRQLHQIDPDWLPYAILRVRNELMRGHAAEALALIPPDELLLQHPDAAAEAWRAALDARSLPHACRLARIAVQAGDRVTLLEFGRALLSQKAVDELVDWVSGDLEWFHRADLRDGWRELLDGALRLNPDSLKALRAWLELAPALATSASPELVARRQRLAELSCQNGDLLTALEQYRQLLRSNPSQEEWRHAVAGLEEQLGLIVPSATASTGAPEPKAEAGFAMPSDEANGSGADDSDLPELLPTADFLVEDDAGAAPSLSEASPLTHSGEFLDLEDEWAEIADQDLEGRIQQIQFFASNGMLAEARQALDEELARLPHESRLQALDTVLRLRQEAESLPSTEDGQAMANSGADRAGGAPELFSLTPLHPDAFSEVEAHPPAGDSFASAALPSTEGVEWLIASTPPSPSVPFPAASAVPNADKEPEAASGTPDAVPAPSIESHAGDELLQDALPDSEADDGTEGAEPSADMGWVEWLHADAAPEPPQEAPKVSEWMNQGSGGEAARLLDDLFQSFRQTVEGSQTASTSDPEHQYNMGVAYFEMGLFEEAIAELQKSFLGWEAQAEPPRDRLLSCGSTIALSFQQMNMPEVALTWYRRTIDAARLPAADSIGLRYEEGRLLEQLGRRQEALECYRQVYATDIDYQDVAECLKRVQMASSPMVS